MEETAQSTEEISSYNGKQLFKTHHMEIVASKLSPLHSTHRVTSHTVLNT